MAVELVWSPEAVEDIEAIASYVERDSPWYAKAVVSRIMETAHAIPAHPRVGRMVPEAGRDDVRERFIYSYRLIYRIEANRVTIVAVIHGRRFLQPSSYRISEAQDASE